MTATPPWKPAGADAIAAYAYARRLAFELQPSEGWFRGWEPFDTMVAPEHWLLSCSQQSQWGLQVVAEAWTSTMGVEPIERTVVGFAHVPAARRRAAMRVGEPFLTRVAFLESPPPPKVTLGDRVWDEHVTTFAASQAEALAAFPTSVRDMLRRRGFRGHLEVRPGGIAVHREGALPTAEGYDATFRIIHDLAATLSRS